LDAMSKPLKWVPEINGAICGRVQKNVIRNSGFDKLKKIRQSINEQGLEMSTSSYNKHALYKDVSLRRE
jgi:hypothetical protein